MGDKVLSREGKSPDRYLRSLNDSLVVQGCDKVNTTRRWAWKQPSLKEIVIDHWSRIDVIQALSRRKCKGLKLFTERTGVFDFIEIATR